jgi:sigma-B regulation protein RsbU (phosphoserine phosphatase)
VDLTSRLRSIYDRLGIVGLVFCISFVTAWFLPTGLPKIFLQFAVVVTGFWLFIRIIRWISRKAIWRLRNRLLVTYTFIAIVPLLLILGMVGGCAYALMSQFAVYLASSELDRRIDMLTSVAETLQYMEPSRRQASVERMFDLYYKQRFQGFEVVVREGDTVFTYPKDLQVQPPPKGWRDVSGIVEQGGYLYGWAHRNTQFGDITITVALNPEFLSGLIPQLGVFELYRLTDDRAIPKQDGSGISRQPSPRRRNLVLNGKIQQIHEDDRKAPKPVVLRPPVNRFDLEVTWMRLVPVYRWSEPSDATKEFALLQIHTRPSLIYDVLFSLKSDEFQGLLPIILAVIGGLFLVVELIALVIGVSMTRTITGAIHELYEGTSRVTTGDFSHRITVKGKDQLAELGHSFNKMTENIQQLLAVAKEKERLQSEIEIAREVQAQLYPKAQPQAANLKLKAVCHPARMVSGDYFDYDNLPGHHIGFVLADVAGKGISAALLMAALQSSVRAQWTHSIEAAEAQQSSVEPVEFCPPISTSRLTSQVNLQLYKNTSPEKYATFFLGLYDPSTSTLRYTNAGHLPPLLFSGETVQRLEIDGTVVGAFPFAEFGESKAVLKPGDLLVCYTDGITEPENAYGEMFGEERLIEIVQKNLHRSDEEIVQSIMDSVLDWTGSPELQDDMTILLARQQ